MDAVMDVLVVCGVGTMGRAVARRVGSGRRIVLADVDGPALDQVAADLVVDGFDAVPCSVDVSDPDSVGLLAAFAAGQGRVAGLAHTAGVSPAQASVERIVTVDLIGSALVLDAFGPVMARGGAAVVIASMAGHLVRLSAEQEHALRTVATAELAALPFVSPTHLGDPGTAYTTAKRGTILRVQGAAPTWAQRGVRVNSISPGTIATVMQQAELSGPHGDTVRALTASSLGGRMGTPEEVAAAADFLLGGASSYTTGADLLLDGGVTAALLAGSATTDTA